MRHALLSSDISCFTKGENFDILYASLGKKSFQEVSTLKGKTGANFLLEEQILSF